MVVWGGLRLIASRLVLDVLSLSGLCYACCAPLHRTNTLVLVGIILLTLVTAGLTNRWALSFPMVPILLLQGGLRRLLAAASINSAWISRPITGLSVLFLLLSAALVILFPAVELPPVNGPYNVGVVDFYLPVEVYNSNSNNNETCSSASVSRVPLSVRLFYPTLEKPDRIPYLRPETAVEFCRQEMKFGAPPPLKGFGWFLHTWRLSKLRAKRNAALFTPQTLGNDKQEEKLLPVVLFSHGLGGTAEIYSYQTMALAAHGSVVLSINHADGSAPIVQHHNGTTTLYDFNLGKIWMEGRHEEYARLRRTRTDHRVQELLAAAVAFLQLNERDEPSLLQQGGISFRSRLQPGKVTFMGHSFGGATALTAAKRRPDLVQAVVAHEPAVDWMPDDARGSLFPSRLLQDLPHDFNGGTGGFVDGNATNDDSLHAVNMLLLFSDEWRQKKWAFSHILEDLHRLGRLGKPGGASSFGVINGAHHSEFSDTCMIMPVWLSRLTGVSGKRNPLHTASEIEWRTRVFLDTVRRAA